MKESIMKSEHYKSVESFMILARQDVPESPCVPWVEVRRLRAKLILEEALETVEALGFMAYVGEEHHVHLEHDGEPNLIEIIDGCCDVSVVTTGTLIACGVPDLPFLNAVNQNNLDKFGPGHSYREDGKLIKPPGHRKPDIQSILNSLKG